MSSPHEVAEAQGSMLPRGLTEAAPIKREAAVVEE
jgi:hypothetical protein